MAIPLPIVAKQILCRSVHALKETAPTSSNIPKGYCTVYVGEETAPTSSNIPKGYCTVYVGEAQKKRFVVPISYLNQPVFQDLQVKAEEEYGVDHPMGGLTIHCREDIFIELTSSLNRI